MNWSARYVGRREAACHCWQLVCDVYLDELGIVLPSYQGGAVSAAERAEAARLVAQEEQAGPWQIVGRHDLQAFDVLVFRRGLHRSHVGLVIDRTHMLHMHGRAVVERFTADGWSRRLTGIYRHIERTVEEVAQ